MKARIKLSLLLALVLLLLASSCNKTPGVTDDESVTSSSDTTTSETQPQGFAIVAGGSSKVRVVRPDMASEAVVNAMVDLCSAIRNITGVAPDVSNDWLSSGEEYDSESPEILIGRTGYGETASALSDVSGGYVIKISGNKLIVAGDSEGATQRAVLEFIDLLPDFLTDSGDLIIPYDINVSGSYFENPLDEIPAYPDGESVVYDSGNGSKTLCVSGITADSFEKYLSSVEEAGYRIYANRTVKSNRFVTLTNKWNVVNAVYVAFEKSARIIVDRLTETALPGLPEENIYTEVCTPLLTMLGVEYPSQEKTVDSYQNGMSFICRLADGSFIIVDGGFVDNMSASRIYEVLRKQAPDPDNIVIAAWILTHAHMDHIGAFMNFSELYTNKVTVETFIHDFPSDEQAAVTNEGGNKNDCIKLMKKYQGSKIILARPGQEYYIRDMKIEMLYTTELFAPKDLDYFNTSSLIFRLYAKNGQSVIFLGDCSEDTNDIISRMYEDYLASDIIQVAHHGSQGGSYRLAQYINPTYVLWPRGQKTFNDSISHSRNTYFRTVKTILGIWCAGSTVTIHEFGPEPGRFVIFADIKTYVMANIN